MCPPSTSHPAKALMFLMAVALFPMNTSADTTRVPPENCKNNAAGCRSGYSLLDDSDETKESESIKTPWEDDSVLRKKRNKTKKRRQPKSTPSGKYSRTIHYGGGIILADLLVVLTLVGSTSASQNPAVAMVGSSFAPLGYLLAAPIIHAYYGEPGSAMGSLLTRLAFPVFGAVGGFLLGMPAIGTNLLAPLQLGAVGFAGGVVSAVFIDAVFLAETTQTTYETRSLATIPSLSITPGGTFTFGLAGHF